METQAKIIPPPPAPPQEPDRTTQFKKAATEGTVLLLPSGYDIRARRVNLRVLLKTGKIPNSLRPIIDQAISGKEVAIEDIAKDAQSDPKVLDDLMGFIDTIWVDCVIDPKCAHAPENPEQRRDDVIYPDEVSDEDKGFFVNWAMGGSSDLERFREEQASGLERVRSVATDGNSTE